MSDRPPQRFFRRPWVWALVLLPLGLALAQHTAFRTSIHIVIEATTARMEVNGTAIQLPLNGAPIDKITVIATEPFEQFGGGSIKITSAKGSQEIFLPKRWTFPRSTRPPGGDWWVDALAPEQDTAELATLPGPWNSPLTIDVDVPGRLMRPFCIRFHGNPGFECALRYGLINNDAAMYFISGPPQTSATAIGGDPGLDLRHLGNTCAKAIVLGCLLVLIFSCLASLDRSTSTVRVKSFWLTARGLTVLALVLVAGRFALSWWVADSLFFRLPHFQDDLCYVLRAKWLLAGSLDRPIPPFPEYFQVPFSSYFKGRWLTHYPILWSAMLAGGMKLGCAWLVAPFCGALAVFFQFRLGSRIANTSAGFIAAVLLALSPFAILLSGSMMNHSATSMLLGLFAWLFVKAWQEEKKGRIGILLLSGVALGAAFGIRPLTAAAMGVPTLLLGLWEWKRHQFSRRVFVELAFFAGGVILGSVPTLIDNAKVTGSPFLFAYGYLTAVPPLRETLPPGLFWSDHSVAQLPMLMTGWGWPWLRGDWWIYLPYGFAAVPFLTGRAQRYDWWLLGLFAAVVVAHFSHGYNTMHGFGPRIYIDALFALFALVARGCHLLPQLWDSRDRVWTRRIAYATILLLCGSTFFTLRSRLERYRGYNDVDDNASRLVDQIPSHRALVLLKPDAMLKWIRLANQLSADPTTADLVIATMLENNDQIITAFGRDRPVYIMEDRVLVPYAP